MLVCAAITAPSWLNGPQYLALPPYGARKARELKLLAEARIGGEVRRCASAPTQTEDAHRSSGALPHIHIALT